MPNSELDQQGFVLLPDLMPMPLLGGLRQRVEELFHIEGERAGAEFKRERDARRLANLVNKGPLFLDVIAEPRVLALVSRVLGGSVKLSSLNARSVNPRSTSPQPLHCDMAALPDEHGAWVCNAVWMLDDFTAENGALRVIPGSHRWGCLPEARLSDPTAPHPEESIVTGTAGSVIVMNAHLWHGGLANHTNAPRTAIHAFYCRRDKPQQQYQKRMLDDSIQVELGPELRDLLALDDSNNDRISGQAEQRSGFLR